jgi:hypothetical protein
MYKNKQDWNRSCQLKHTYKTSSAQVLKTKNKQTPLFAQLFCRTNKFKHTRRKKRADVIYGKTINTSCSY